MSDDELQRHALLLSAETGADPRTAQRWLEGASVQKTTDYALRMAAEKLGIARPENVDAAAGAA